MSRQILEIFGNSARYYVRRRHAEYDLSPAEYDLSIDELFFEWISDCMDLNHAERN